MAHTNRADICIWLVTVLVGAVAESLAPSQQLHVCLNTNDGLIRNLSQVQVVSVEIHGKKDSELAGLPTAYFVLCSLLERLLYCCCMAYMSR